MKYAVMYIECDVDYAFFKRFISSLELKGLKPIFLLNKLSFAVRCIFDGIQFKIVRRNKLKIGTLEVETDLTKARDVATGQLSLNDAKKLYTCVRESIQFLIAKFSIEIVFVINGESIPTKAVAEVCKRNNKSILFFELGNIPGKMFVDTVGVNAQSSLFLSIEKLRDYPVSSKEYEQWKDKYIANKLALQAVPKKARMPNILFFLDLLGFYFFNIPANGEKSIFKKLLYFLRTRTVQFKFDPYDITDKRFIFLPLQLTNDTQLLLNSTITNYDAIKIAHEAALSMNADLVVKIHPLESDPGTLKIVDKMRGVYNFYVVNSNTVELILKCVKVITINSTTGLEAMICGREVTFLGKSFFSKLNVELLKNYILSYLVDIDYYSTKLIDPDTLNLLFERTGIAHRNSNSYK